MTQHQKGPVVSEDQNWLFAIFWIAVLSAQLNAIFFLKSDIGFLRYGNFIQDIITDWWKVDFEKKAILRAKLTILCTDSKI